MFAAAWLGAGATAWPRRQTRHSPLTRTTRSVSPTVAGERLLQPVGHRIEEIEAERDALSELWDKPAGTIRITATEYASESILFSKLASLLPHYPDIRVEVVVDYGLTDIVSQRYDAGAMGRADGAGHDHRAHGPGMRMAVVAAPAYFATRSTLKKPQDLARYNCINLWLPSHARMYPWEFEQGKRKLNVHVEGRLVLNSAPADGQRSAGGVGPRLRAGGHGRDVPRERSSQASTRGLVPSVFGLPSLRCEPPPLVTGVCAGGGYAAIPRADE